MEQMAIHQEAAYERLYRWMQSILNYLIFIKLPNTYANNHTNLKMNVDYYATIQLKLVIL